MFLLPSSILAGAILPFEAMPELMQSIGKLFPQRWITCAVEILQAGGGLMDAVLPLMGVLVISLVMFVFSSVRLSKVKK